MRIKTKRRLKKAIKALSIVIIIGIGVHFAPNFLPQTAKDALKQLAKESERVLQQETNTGVETLKQLYNEYVSSENGSVLTENGSSKRQINISQPKTEGVQIPAYILGHQVVDHEYYVLSFNDEWKIPDWVAYTIDLYELNTQGTSRTEDFRPDPDIINGSAQLSDYRNSGYDRGHLFPSASANSSVDKNSSTFLMSNMVPQIHRFNAGLWLKAEDAERDAGRMYGEVFCVSGPVITDDMDTIGANRVGVPKACYKVLLVYDENNNVHTIGMVLPQEYENGNLKPYFMTVNEVEEITGIDFFPTLDDAIEEIVEGTYDLSKWPKSFS